MARKPGKENPKGKQALDALKAFQLEIGDERGIPKVIGEHLADLWQQSPEYRLEIWLRYIGDFPKRSDLNPVLACSALVQGYLKLLGCNPPLGVFKHDLRSPGKGRRQPQSRSTVAAMERMKEGGSSYGEIARRYLPDLPSSKGYIRVRDLIRSSNQQVWRRSPLRGELFDQVCRMLGVPTEDEQAENDIVRAEAGEFDAEPESTDGDSEEWDGTGFAPG